MKKIYILLLTMLSCVVSVYAQTFEVDGISYTITNNPNGEVPGKVEVTKRNDGYSGNIVIPDDIVYNNKTYQVKSIGKYAFSSCSDLTSVILGDQLTTIGYEAFSNCTSLKSITLPETVEIIDGFAFYKSGLEEFVLPPKVVKLDATFQGCKALKRIKLHNKLSDLGFQTFWGCESLDSIQIPEGIVRLQGWVFSGCSRLKTFNFPKSLKFIGHDAFSDCLAIDSLIIPNTVTGFSSNVFKGCSNLIYIDLPDSLFWYSDSWDNAAFGAGIFTDCNKLQHIQLPTYCDNALKLDLTFSGCNSLREIIIPKIFNTITNNAFSGCTNLRKIILQDSEEIININNCDGYSNNANLFKDCPLEDLYIGRNVSFSIPGRSGFTLYGQFNNQKKLNLVNLKGNITDMVSDMFNACIIKQLVVGSNLTSIQKGAFIKSKVDAIEVLSQVPPTLSSMEFEKTVVYVPDGSGAAYRADNKWSNNLIVDKADPIYTVNLKYAGTLIASMKQQGISVPGDVSRLKITGNFNQSDWEAISNNMPHLYYLDLSGTNASYVPANQFKDNYKLIDIILPESIFEIGVCAFKGCTHLRNAPMAFPSCKVIGKEAFANSNVGDVEFLSPVSIAEGAFQNCEGLSSVSFLGATCSIGSSCFSNCVNLQVINFPQSVSEIGEYAMQGCTSLSQLHIPNGTLSIKDYAFANSGIQSLTIGDSVQSIGEYAFMDCSNLVGVIVLPASIKTISKGLFKNCGSLTTVTISDKTSKICSEAFEGCTSLQYVNLPQSLRTIESGAFEGCDSLAEIEIPNWLVHFDGAFKNTGLKKIRTHWQVPLPITEDTFMGVNEDECMLTVPNNSVPNYLTADVWKNFWMIEEDESETVEIISFADENVKAVCLNNWDVNGDGEIGVDEALRVKDLGDAFSNNEDIASFDELKYFCQLSEIGKQTFAGCNALTSIYIPDEIISIVPQAFDDCKNLESIVVSENNTVYDSRNGCNAIIQSLTNEIIRGCKNTIFDETILSVGERAFYNCSGMEEVVIPTSVKAINQYAFYGCEELKYVTIGDSVKQIGAYGFAKCPLKVLFVGKSVKEIDTSVFWGSYCDTVYINNNELLGTYYDTHYSNSQYRTRSLCQRTFGGVKCYVLDGNVTNVRYRAFYDCSELQTVVIGKSVENISYNAFENCPNLTFVEFMDGITTINSSAFSGIRSINQVLLPNTLKVIGESAFYNTQLQIINLPESVEIIGKNAFYNCPLENLDIPVGVNEIGELAFCCGSLTNVTVHWTNPLPIEGQIFASNQSNCTLHIPTGSKPLYLGADIWNKFGKIWEPAVLGDVNDDGSINVSDIAGQVNLILNESSIDYRYDAADINVDGRIRVDDLTDLLTMILEDETSNLMARKTNHYDGTNQIDTLLTATSNELCVNLKFKESVKDFTGLQFDILLPGGLTVENVKTGTCAKNHDVVWKQREDGSIRVILYSMDNSVLRGDAISIAFNTTTDEGSDYITLNNIIATTVDAQSEYISDISVQLDMGVTDISTMVDREPYDNIVYDIKGRVIRRIGSHKELESLPQGIYIVNGKKVIVK